MFSSSRVIMMSMIIWMMNGVFRVVMSEVVSVLMVSMMKNRFSVVISIVPSTSVSVSYVSIGWFVS